jgi:hypothetical protein
MLNEITPLEYGFFILLFIVLIHIIIKLHTNWRSNTLSVEQAQRQDSSNKTKELEQKKLIDAQHRLQNIVKQYTHSLGNTIFPETLYNIAQKLKKHVEFKEESLLLYDAYHAEVSILHQSELLRIKHVTQDSELFRALICQERLFSDSVEPSTNIKHILNYALERMTARFLNENYAKLEKIRERVLHNRHLSLQELRQNFETQILFEEEPLKWVQQHLLPIQLVEFSEQWENVKLKKNGYAEALLYSYFDELFLNVFKYSDYQWLKLRFYEQEIGDVTYLVSTWENAYIDNTSISTGNGLEGISDDLRILNDSENETTTLQVVNDKAQAIFRVTLFFRKELFIFEIPEYEYAILQ